jgi:peptidoglycan/LPS O-acetylase OafA/YrhL
MQTLADVYDPKNNSIGFLRLLSAIMVVVAHSSTFGALGPGILIDETNNQLGLGRIPVDLFFALSGFLITASYLRLKSLWLFLWHRFLRIYPAFWVCIFLTATVLPLSLGYRYDALYVIKNFLLVTGIHKWHVSKLFVDNPTGRNANGALWTLPWECRAYLIIAALGLIKLLNKRAVMYAVFFISWAWLCFIVLSNPGAYNNAAISSGLRLLTFFFCGCCFYLDRNIIPMDYRLAIASVAVLVTSILIGNRFVPYSGGLYYMVAPIPFTYLVFWLVVALPRPFQKINVKTDLSYGIYIYGTIMLNLFTYLGLNRDFWSYNAMVLAATTVLALLSWYLVEKPALSLKGIFSSKEPPKQVEMAVVKNTLPDGP